jgi:hypothetical protein
MWRVLLLVCLGAFGGSDSYIGAAHRACWEMLEVWGLGQVQMVDSIATRSLPGAVQVERFAEVSTSGAHSLGWWYRS